MRIQASTISQQYLPAKEASPVGTTSHFSEDDQIEISPTAMNLSSTASLFLMPLTPIAIPPGGSSPYGGGG